MDDALYLSLIHQSNNTLSRFNKYCTLSMKDVLGLILSAFNL